MILDILLLIFIITGFLTGFRKGLIQSVFSFIALFFGIMLALKYSYVLSDYLYENNLLTTKFLPFISFFFIFLFAIVVAGFLARIVETVAKALFMGTINRMVGGIFWTFLTLLLFSTILWYLDQLQFITTEMKTTSMSYSYFITFAPVVIDLFSSIIPFFKGLFESLEMMFQEMQLQPQPAPKNLQV